MSLCVIFIHIDQDSITVTHFDVCIYFGGNIPGVKRCSVWARIPQLVLYFNSINSTNSNNVWFPQGCSRLLLGCMASTHWPTIRDHPPELDLVPKEQAQISDPVNLSQVWLRRMNSLIILHCCDQSGCKTTSEEGHFLCLTDHIYVLSSTTVFFVIPHKGKLKSSTL